MTMEHLDGKKALVLLLVCAAFTLASGEQKIQPFRPPGSGHHGLNLNDFCTISKNGGLYDKNFLRCCKEKFINGSIHLFLDTKECRANMTANNPNDDLATSMWRVEACKVKELMGVEENELNFKSFVEFMTKYYTNETDIQNLVRDANKECPDGEKETEFHKRIEAYYLCFYKKEEETCSDPTPDGLKAKEKHMAVTKNFTLYIPEQLACPAYPGILYGPAFYCCKGKNTPRSWQYFTSPFPFNRDQDEVKLHCTTNITKLIHSSKMEVLRSIPLNSTDKMFKYQDMSTLFSCHDACNINPVLFKNDSVTPEITFDMAGILDKRFSKMTAAVRNDLKEMVLRYKADFKTEVKFEDFYNATGITLNEIETQFNGFYDQLMKIHYYCSYYRHLNRLIEAAGLGYCISEDAAKKFLDQKVRMHFNF